MANEPEITISTVYYEATHEGAPHPNNKGNWAFQPPANYGRRPWLFQDMSYAAAKRELAERATWGGEFYLLP